MSEGPAPSVVRDASLMLSIYGGYGLGIMIVLALRMLLFLFRQRGHIDPAARARLLRAASIMGLSACSVVIAITPILLLTRVHVVPDVFYACVFGGLVLTPIVIWVARTVRAVRRRLGDALRSRPDSDGTANSQ